MAGAFEPEIAQVTSNDLEATVRNLLPSVAGFGSRLGAQNVIVPVVDLTPTAEGSTLGENLQTALAFGNQTAFDVNNASATLANAPGFWRVTGAATVAVGNGGSGAVTFQMSDSVSTKNVWELSIGGNGCYQNAGCNFDLIFFLRADDSITAISSAAGCVLAGSYRQIADVNGILVNPTGFTTL